MTASNELFCVMVWPLPETAMGILCTCLVGALQYTSKYKLRNTTIPLAGTQGSPPRTNDPTRPPAMATAKTNKKNE